METFREIDTLPWKPVRPDVATDVEGRTLLSSPTKVVLTRVRPGGRFNLHRDGYAHLFHFLEGDGVVQVGEETRATTPGMLVSVAAGVLHGYANTGEKDLLLLSFNLPRACE